MGFLSEKMPKSGCTIDELTVAANTRAPGRGERDPTLRRKERHQRRHGALIEVGEQVPSRQPRHRPPVNAFVGDLAQYRFLLE